MSPVNTTDECPMSHEASRFASTDGARRHAPSNGPWRGAGEREHAGSQSTVPESPVRRAQTGEEPVAVVTTTVPVSVIVACYNAAPFLRQCIASIHTHPQPSEVIVVDDGSTDGSLELARQLATEYPNLRVLANPDNMGAAEARFRGITAAKEDWVAWVDADDLLEPGAIGDAYARVGETADMCIWDLWRLRPDGSSFRFASNPEALPVSGATALRLTLPDWRIHSLGVTRKSLFLKAYQDCGVQSFNRDELISRLVLQGARQVVGSPRRYYYRINPQSTTRIMSDKQLTRLRSNLWLIDLACGLPGAPLGQVVRESVEYAYTMHEQRRCFTGPVLRDELRSFVLGLARRPAVWRSILASRLHLRLIAGFLKSAVGPTWLSSV